MSAPQDLIAGRYRLVNLVGSGGMGSVWEAYDERLRRPVAVKQLHRPIGLPPAEADLANQRAMREARITARLNHRHAVTVFDVAEHEGQPCLIMQFLPSIPLSDVLRETGRLQPHEAAKVAAQVSSALAAAHAVDILHRDVKPGNILIAEDGTALISDFGIARALGDATLTTTGMVHGTPAFLAPEVARGARVQLRLRCLLPRVDAVRRGRGHTALRSGHQHHGAAPSGGLRGVPAAATRRAVDPDPAGHAGRRPGGATDDAAGRERSR